jgi:hypothetical protein
MVSAYFQIPGQIKENQGHPGSVWFNMLKFSLFSGISAS